MNPNYVLPFPPCMENRLGEEAAPQHLACVPPPRTKPAQIVPFLMGCFWALLQHACRVDTDLGTMGLCALLASRAIRFSANCVTSTLSRA